MSENVSDDVEDNIWRAVEKCEDVLEELNNCYAMEAVARIVGGMLLDFENPVDALMDLMYRARILHECMLDDLNNTGNENLEESSDGHTLQ